MASSLSDAPLSFWEKADLFAGNLSVLGTVLYSVITGVFRGKNGAKTFNHHVAHAAVRKAITRLSVRQLQWVYLVLMLALLAQILSSYRGIASSF